ncbi:hypothetical protein [Pseudomonas poae]|uniref:hypothetical protein n=1 Tax=Pseudomonas poae TaxID=200451 RepID=UPI0011CDAEF3|nr:hypothetical protein [Pseudomonas poae]
MSVGIEAFNEKGFKIFGTDYANLVHYGTTTLTVVGGTYSIIANTVVYWDAYAAVPNDGSTVRFYRANFPVVEQGGLVRAPIPNIGQKIECYSFGPVKPSSKSSQGIEVYAPDGTVTFNSGLPFLKLVGMHQDSRASLLGISGPYSYAEQYTDLTATKVAWSVGSPRYICRQQMFSNGRTDTFEYILACRMEDNGRYTNYATQYGPTYSKSGWVGNANHVPPTGNIRILVADVSGL